MERVYKPNSVLPRQRRKSHAACNGSDGHSSGRQIALHARATYPGTSLNQETVETVPDLASDGLPSGRPPIWSCTAESLPSHECRHPCWWALTLSPKAPPFHPSPVPDCSGHRLVCFLLHLSSGHPAWPLASPPPSGVRTFLPYPPFQYVNQLERKPL